MKIALVAMSGVRVRTAELAALGVTLPGFVRRGKVIASLPSLGLLTVAGMTPARHIVSYHEFDEQFNFDTIADADLVAISSLTARIDEAYALAQSLRQRGKKVIMGGLHVSKLPNEALKHCDAVVIGGAERAWLQILSDFENSDLKLSYFGSDSDVFAEDSYVMPRFDLLAGRPYNRITIQTSRGCPRACEFCGASLMITRQFNQKPVDKVIAEIREVRKHWKTPFIEFADDNTFLDRNWSIEFLRALSNEGVRYFTETDASIAEDPELCDRLADSGCTQLLIGFESPNKDDLSGMDPNNWKRVQSAKIRRTIDRIQSRGIAINGCFILGLDTHTPDVFSQLEDFVRKSGLAEVQYTVLTPFPGTPLYSRLKHSGRLLCDRFWDRCTLFDVTFRPQQMSVADLEEGLRWLFKSSYSRSAVSERNRAFFKQRLSG